MLKHFDARRAVVILDEEKLIPFTAELFFNAYQEEIIKKGFFAVCLAGGSTPKKLYEFITSHPKAKLIDKDKIHLFWGDERAVAPNDRESNYKMALEAGFARWNVTPSHIHRMVAEQNIEENASLYEKEIVTLLKDKGFDMLFLGMGDDGHTASLFPHTEALKEKNKKVVANFVEQKNGYRMTLTFPMINLSKNIIFLVTGAAKADMIEKIFSKEGSRYPCFHVGVSENKALWILDTSAAKPLL